MTHASRIAAGLAGRCGMPDTICMSAWAQQVAPGLDAFAELAEQAWLQLPAPFRNAAGDLIFRVEELADEEVLQALELEDPFTLTGLYEGVALPKRSVFDPPPEPGMVTLYRRALLDEWAERANVSLKELVRYVLVHEVGHHFGFSDDAMDAILAQSEEEPP